jgi:hypothetical protein
MAKQQTDRVLQKLTNTEISKPLANTEINQEISTLENNRTSEVTVADTGRNLPAIASSCFPS